MTDSQRYEQRQDLNLFIEVFDEVDQSRCDFTDEPDLIVRYNGRAVGIEHTRLYREDLSIPSGRRLRPQEVIHWQLVERAREIFRAQSSALLSLHVTFKEPFNYRQRNVEHEANVLAGSVLEVLSRLPTSDAEHAIIRIQSWQAQRLSIPFPQGIDAYCYKVEQAPDMEIWAPAYGYAVPTLTVEQIEKRICEKEQRLDSYRTRCDDIWLLIVTHTGMPSSHFEITSDLEHHCFTTTFERLFLLSPFPRRLIELQIQKPNGNIHV